MASRDSTDVIIAFCRAVRSLWIERGLSQEPVAEVAGIHRTYVGDVERGQRNLGLLNIDRLAKALAVELSELMTEVERQRRRRTMR